MLVRSFCTLTDSHYLAQTVTMFESLRSHARECHLFVLCLDQRSYDAISGRHDDKITAVKIVELESADAELRRVKSDRDSMEYYMTCKPSWMLYLLRSHPPLERLVYLDADLFFFSDPDQVLAKYLNCSAVLTEHRFPSQIPDAANKFGNYNGGFVAVRNSPGGIRCLEEWRDSCIRSCKVDSTRGLYYDQGYLSRWPELAEDTAVLKYKGMNLAPWNWMDSTVSIEHGQVLVDKEQLIFYHFAGFRSLTPHFQYGGIIQFLPRVSIGALISYVAVRLFIYRPYVFSLLKNYQELLGSHRMASQHFFYRWPFRDASFSPSWGPKFLILLMAKLSPVNLLIKVGDWIF